MFMISMLNDGCARCRVRHIDS